MAFRVNANIFENSFILEMANNHWGRLAKGLSIIQQYSQVVRFNNIKGFIKFQLRDVDRFIHRDFRRRQDIRYIQKTMDTILSNEDYVKLASAARNAHMGW